MKSRLTLTLALLLLCTGAALAQTPDGQTPAEETVCDSETGAAFGLCNAYCEAMDCESADPQASATACTKVKNKFTQVTGRNLPCDLTCACQALPEWGAVLAGEFIECAFAEGGTFRVLVTSAGIIAGGVQGDPPQGGCVAQLTEGEQIILPLTPEQGAACINLVDSFCPAEPGG